MWQQQELAPDPDLWKHFLFSHTVIYFFLLFVITALYVKYRRNTSNTKTRLFDPRVLKPVQEKQNLHPFLLPDVLREILSHTDILTLYKCRVVNSEWANIARDIIKRRFGEVELESRSWKELPYRPSPKEVHDSVLDEDRAERLRTFYETLSLYRSYPEGYPMLNHYQDLLVSRALGKKIFDHKNNALRDLYSHNHIMSPEFPFLLKIKFKYQSYKLNFKRALSGLTYVLTPKMMPKSLPMITGCKYEALFDMARGKAYNVRLLKEPQIAFGLLPTNQVSFLTYLFGLAALVADTWTIFPHVFDWLLVLLSGALLGTFIHKEFPKMAGVILLEISVLMLFNFWALFDMLKLLVVVCMGYTIQSMLIRARQLLETTEKGKFVIGVVMILDLISMNANLQLFVTSVKNGNILWTLLYYVALFGFGIAHMYVCFWMYPNNKNRHKIRPGFWLRLASLLFIYTFFNPE